MTMEKLWNQLITSDTYLNHIIEEVCSVTFTETKSDEMPTVTMDFQEKNLIPYEEMVPEEEIGLKEEDFDVIRNLDLTT